jgi:hypothetical protein
MRRENLADNLIRLLTLFDHPDHVAIPERSKLRTRRSLPLPVNDRAAGDEQKYANQPPIPVHDTPTREGWTRSFSNGHAAKFGRFSCVFDGLTCGI